MAYVIAGAQAQDHLAVHIGRRQLVRLEIYQGAEDRAQELLAREDGGGVDEGVFEVGVAREQLRLQEVDVLDVAEEGCEDLGVGQGVVFQLDFFEERHDYFVGVPG